MRSLWFAFLTPTSSIPVTLYVVGDQSGFTYTNIATPFFTEAGSGQFFYRVPILWGLDTSVTATMVGYAGGNYWYGADLTAVDIATYNAAGPLVITQVNETLVYGGFSESTESDTATTANNIFKALDAPPSGKANIISSIQFISQGGAGGVSSMEILLHSLGLNGQISLVTFGATTFLPGMAITEQLDWYWANPSSPSSVSVTGRVNYDQVTIPVFP